MPQYSFSDPTPLAGTLAYCGGPDPDLIEIFNPLRVQIGDIDVDGTTTDGTYVLTATGSDGSSFTASYTAASKSAAQIAAGWAAAINEGIVSRGFATATVHDTDQFSIAHVAPGVKYTYALSGPSGPDVLSNVQEAGYADVPVGIILQADGSGGFTTTYTDAALALGVTIRNSNLVQSYDPNSTEQGYSGPSMMTLVASGYVKVQVAAGVTVARGNKVYFNSTTETWSNATTGSHVLVEGAQWQTSGTGVQIARVRFPSET
jgi:hypothetical protein